jgi:hypothetical protein
VSIRKGALSIPFDTHYRISWYLQHKGLGWVCMGRKGSELILKRGEKIGIKQRN